MQAGMRMYPVSTVSRSRLVRRVTQVVILCTIIFLLRSGAILLYYYAIVPLDSVASDESGPSAFVIVSRRARGKKKRGSGRVVGWLGE